MSKYLVRVFPEQLRSEWVVDAQTPSEALEWVRRNNWISPHGELSVAEIDDSEALQWVTKKNAWISPDSELHRGISV